MTGGDPRAAVHDLVTAGAHPALRHDGDGERDDRRVARALSRSAERTRADRPTPAGHFGPLRRPVRARGAGRRARRADRGVRRRPGPTRRSWPSSTHLHAHVHRPPDPAHRGDPASRARRRRARSCSSARTSTTPASHKINNVPRPGAADRAHGQDPGDRRDRRRPARRRHRDGCRPARARVRRLHGRGGHPPPGAQRRPDAAARRRGGPGRPPAVAHPQGRDQRGDARLGHQRRRPPTTCSAPSPARTRSRRWCATSTG